jgi:glycosyltransferase involved in cell wall biosynthesis
MKKKLIVIPMRNSASMIQKVIAELNSADGISGVDILILDNDSTDKSVKVAKNALENFEFISQKSQVIQNSTNLGYGGSLIKGLNWGLSNEYDWFYILHSDDQADWTKVFEDLDAAVNSDMCDVVLTSRFHADAQYDGYSTRRVAGNLIFKVITKITIGSKITDPGAAVCAFNKATLLQIPFAELNESYHFHPQFNVYLNYCPHLSILEAPIAWKNATSGERFSLILYGIGLLRFLITFSFSHRVKGRSVDESLRKAI